MPGTTTISARELASSTCNAVGANSSCEYFYRNVIATTTSVQNNVVVTNDVGLSLSFAILLGIITLFGLFYVFSNK